MGNKESSTNPEKMERMRLAEQVHLSLRAIHIKRDLNQKADWLSMYRVNNSEWSLSQEIFNFIVQMLSLPSTNLFVNHTNAKRPKYFIREADPRSVGTDPLFHRWLQGLHYAYPPFLLLGKVVQKMKREQAVATLITPHWPRKSYFSDLIELKLEPPLQLPWRLNILS